MKASGWARTSKIPNIRGYRNDVVEALKKIHVPVMRWPGGCFADLYDWRDGIGPRAKRPVRVNVHWGGVTEDNSFGTHEFMDFAELIGAEAYVSLNVGSLTPYDRAQWLEYMTSDSQSSLANERRKNGRAKPWNVKFRRHRQRDLGLRRQYAPRLCRRHQCAAMPPSPTRRARWVRSRSPAVQRMTTYYDFAEDDDEAMAAGSTASACIITPCRAIFRDKGPATGFPESEWASTLSHALHIEEIVTKTAAIMDKYDPDKKIGLYVDEWGTWYDQEPGSHPGFLYQQNTLRDAQVAALSLNIFHRHSDRVKRPISPR